MKVATTKVSDLPSRACLLGSGSLVTNRRVDFGLILGPVPGHEPTLDGPKSRAAQTLRRHGRGFRRKKQTGVIN